MQNKILFGIMTLVFNAVGVPQFMQGETGKGIGHICLSVFTCSIGAIILEIKGIIDGIKILKMSDEEYAATYLNKAETPAE